MKKSRFTEEQIALMDSAEIKEGKQPITEFTWLATRAPAWRRVRVRSSKYLNNIIEQDHRAIKRRCASMKGFKSFANAAVTIAGVELAHRIHKHQFSLGRGRPRSDRSLRTDWERAVA